MEDLETSGSGSTFLAFLLGAVAGAGLALLMAPKTGDEMRSRIRDMSKDALDKSKEYAKTVQEKARTMMEQGKGMVEQGTQAVKEQAGQAMGTAIDTAKEKMEQHKPTTLS